jgi:hypothetical protein
MVRHSRRTRNPGNVRVSVARHVVRAAQKAVCGGIFNGFRLRHEQAKK